MKPFQLDEIIAWLQENREASAPAPPAPPLEGAADLRFTPDVSLVFLTRDRMRQRLLAIIRRYRLQAREDLQRLLQRINPHLPGRGELRAVLRFTFPHPGTARYERARIRGLEQPDRIFLLFQPGPRVPFACTKRVWEPGTRTMVYHLTACLPDDAVARVHDSNIALHFIVDHPNLFLRARVPDAVRSRIGADLTAGTTGDRNGA